METAMEFERSAMDLLPLMLVAGAAGVALAVWLWPNRRRDKAEIEAAHRRWVEERNRELATIDARVADMIRRRRDLNGDDR